MAEAAIFHLLGTIKPFFENELKLLSGVGEEIEYIRNEFERMTSLLEVVEAHGNFNPELKGYVSQVRDASYEAGDVLEQLTLCHNRYNDDGIYKILHKVSCVAMTLRIRHQVATKLRRIKFRLGDIALEYKRHPNLIGMRETWSYSQTDHEDSGYDSHGVALSQKNHKIVGMDRRQAYITKWLENNYNRVQVLSVVGMGGMGKTTLVKKVFGDKETKKLFESYAWITVSATFKIDDLFKDIVRQLFEGGSQQVPKEMQQMDTNRLKTTIFNFLQEKRYLIVLDDVWHTHAWQALRYAFPDNNHGSRVVLTTRITNVASSACKDFRGNIYNLSHLSEEEAWTLFCQKAFQGQACPLHLEKISRDILKKCEGVPLAIVSIGGLLSTKDQKGIYEWDRVYCTLGTELEGNGNLQSLQQVLLLAYVDLPYHLKICFLYLSIFPENYLMDHWRLVRLLVAEGFVETKPGLTIEEVAENYLMELENRSLILVQDRSVNGSAKTYHIHDMWRETIVPKSMEQNLVIIAGARNENKWPNRIRRLSIHDGFQNWKETKHFTNQLRSLLIFGSTDKKSAMLLLASLRAGAKLLKVLDFRRLPMTTLPRKNINLPYLKYLSLRGNGIKEIPKSIGNLQLLETLDLKDTLVTALPNEITKLQFLRHLLVYRYLHEPFYLPFNDQIGFKAINEIGKLSRLQKLCSIELNQVTPNKDILIEIGKLSQLRRINILKVKSDDVKALCLSLGKLVELRSLSIGATNAEEVIDLDHLSLPPQHLQTLVIKGQLANMPHWISSLQNVVRLDLRHSKLKDDPLKPLQGLPKLGELLLERAYEGEELSFETKGFQSLKILVLDSLSRLRHVKVIEGAMPKLEKLHIFGCALLNEIPSGIESLSCLKDFQMIDSSKALISNPEKDMPNGGSLKNTKISKVLIGGLKDSPWRRHHS